jgi:hypothetical protein
MSERIRSWLDSFDGRVETETERRCREQEEDENIFVQLDAAHDERVERKDAKWWPSGPDPDSLEALVRERRARGVLYISPKRRHSRLSSGEN